MGLFVDDPKPPAPTPVIQEVKQDWLAVLIGGIFALLGMLLVFMFKAAEFILKPIFSYLFTFDGRTRQQITTQMAIAIALIGTPIFLVYQIPLVRDFISLKKTHTINHTRNGERLLFPGREYFEITSERRWFDVGERKYFTYPGYTKNKMQAMYPNHCQLLTRSEKIGLLSEGQPVVAEGFDDGVTYIVELNAASLRGLDYLFQRLRTRETWFNADAMKNITVQRQKTSSSWQEFIDDWNSIRPEPRGRKGFEVKALAREHAIVCF